MAGEIAASRQILAIGGSDRIEFLQGLITNDVNRLADGMVYAALLSPQGKFLADFFLVPDGDRVLLDVDEALAPALLQRLTMYKLRAAVSVEAIDLPVTRGTGPAPEGAFADPRHEGMGWRAYGLAGIAAETDWDALRVEYGVPETGAELIAGDSYILEMGFEQLNGVDFRKGCYVGQEVTARMKHKTELKKGLAVVTISGEASAGSEITSEGRPVGTLHTRSGNRALAYLRFGRAEGTMSAGEATITMERRLA